MKLDHQIYGTFPELPGSQQVVYKSSGIDDDLQSWLIQQYDRYGDCKTEDFRSSLTFQWYRGGETPLGVLTKVTHHGKDFSGRWGALLRQSAIITEDQFVANYGCLDAISSQLVEGGTPDELSQSGDLEIAAEIDRESLIGEISRINLANSQENLRKLLMGQRLVLYSDLNTENTNRYLRNLVQLLPLKYRLSMDWSEFVFRELDELDLSVVYSSRYSAPESDMIAFNDIGEVQQGESILDEEEAVEYIAALAAAIETRDATAINELIFQSDAASVPENTEQKGEQT